MRALLSYLFGQGGRAANGKLQCFTADHVFAGGKQSAAIVWTASTEAGLVPSYACTAITVRWLVHENNWLKSIGPCTELNFLRPQHILITFFAGLRLTNFWRAWTTNEPFYLGCNDFHGFLIEFACCIRVIRAFIRKAWIR